MVCLICDKDKWDLEEHPCGHIYCQFCLEQMTESSEKVSCPICRLDWFKPFGLLHSLIEEKKTDKILEYISDTTYFPISKNNLTAIEHCIELKQYKTALIFAEINNDICLQGILYLIKKKVLQEQPAVAKKLIEKLPIKSINKMLDILVSKGDISSLKYFDKLIMNKRLVFLFITAIESNQINSIKFLIKKDSLIINRLCHNKSPLMHAACISNKNTINYLLDCGALVNQKNSDNLYAFDFACKYGNIVALELLKNSIRYSNKGLYLAIQSNQFEVINWLYINGYDFNTNDGKGIPVIFYSETIKMLKKMILYGAELNKCDLQGNSILHYAINTNNFNIVKHLTEDLFEYLPNQDWTTVLHLAFQQLPIYKNSTFDVKKKHDDSQIFQKSTSNILYELIMPLEELLNEDEIIENPDYNEEYDEEYDEEYYIEDYDEDYDEDFDEDYDENHDEDIIEDDEDFDEDYEEDFEPKITDDIKESQEYFGDEQLSQDLSELVIKELQDILEPLLDRYPTNENLIDDTPSQMEKEYNAEKLTKLILNKYSKYLNTGDKLGKTPVHYLIKTGNINMIKEVGKLNADFNISDNQGVTPFELACLSKNNLLITTMINCGANNTFTTIGSSLITKLLINKEYEIVELLLKNGCSLCADPITKQTELHLFSKDSKALQILKPYAKKYINSLDIWGKTYNE